MRALWNELRAKVFMEGAHAGQAWGNSVTARFRCLLLPDIRIKERAEESEDEIIDIDAEIKSTRTDIANDLVKNRINLKKIMRYSNATPFRDVKTQGYLCCYCPKMFPDPADLKTHTIAIHDEDTKMTLMKQLRVYCVKLDITNLECSKCNAEMESLEDLMDHLINAHYKALYKNIKNFLLPFKFEDRVWFDCAICAKRFSKFKMLLEHMNMHYRNFVCDVCDAGFAYRDILRHHSRIHVKGEFVCSFCSKQYDTLRKKKGHESAVHKRAKMVNKCGVCDAKFVSYQTKLRHMADLHGIDMVVIECDSCDRTFTNPSAHRIHVQRDHLLERKFQCNLCGKKFFDNDLLKNHVVTHTGERPYQCLICLKKFQRRSSHREHMRIHADDRRYKCEHCGMAFVQRCTWRTHMRKRHGVTI